MKIVCPECQAAYEIDAPESPAKDLSAKCAVCNSKFPIKKTTLERASHSPDLMTGPPLAQIDSGPAPESTDDFLSGLQEDQQGLGELHLDQEESFDDKNLDDYLDQLLENGLGEFDNETLDESAQLPPAETTSPGYETPSEDDLDRLFDSLIAEEIKPPVIEESATDSSLPPEKDPGDEDLDALLDEIMRNNLDVEEGADPKAGFDGAEAIVEGSEPQTTENVEIDKPVANSMDNAEQEIETPQPENLSPENDTEKNPDEKDPLVETRSEEKIISNSDQKDDPEATFEDQQETAESEPSADQQEEEKSDEDLWAEAFADQEAVEETTEDDDTEKESEETAETVDPKEEETIEETAKSEPSTDQQEEEKSDEDLWAEAFADQEALKETTEGDETEKKSEETAETVDLNGEEEGAEENVEAEAVMDSDEETGSVDEEADYDAEADFEEDADSEEEPERNEFGLSEADYEDDDDEVGDQYDEYQEDEEEFSPSAKKKFAFLTLPSTKTGKLVLGGGVLAVLLTGGGAYFALQTLAPPELTQMTKNSYEVPQSLKPKDTQESSAFKNPSGNAPAEKPNPALSAALGTGDASPLAKDKEKLNTPPKVESDSGVSKGLVAALAPSNHAVQLGTIMPVAYNINDIRVLSFNLEAEMSDAESAQVIREALPVFEKITITTVERLMDKKFFNDILYVKEKLKKNLQNNFNKTLEGGGRVKKITFKDFTVQ